MTLGTVYLLFQYQALLRRPLGEMTRQLQDFQRAGASVERVQHLAVTPHVPDGPGAALPPGPLAVEFDAVDFAYAPQGAAPGPAGCRFTVHPGEVLGLLGRTGSARPPSPASCCASTTPPGGPPGRSRSRRLRRDGLRREVAMVTQDVQLFRATVRDNLTLFDRSVPEGSVLGPWSAWGCSLAGASPAGTGHPLGPGGEGSPPGRLSCWPADASSCATRAWSSWTRPPPASTRPRSASSPGPSTGSWRGGRESSSPTAWRRYSGRTPFSSWRGAGWPSGAPAPPWAPTPVALRLAPAER